ncbi:MAG: DNA polymerase III subunit delta [Chloroflexi bacterium]|nr:DNA polymerase III subunit delta [Chloroflexota bacterium]
MLYILYGSELLARRDALERLKESLDSDGSLATNTTYFDAARSSPQEVIAACDTVPFLGEHRLILGEGLLSQATRRGRRGDDEDDEPPPDAGRWEPLVDYVPNMPPSSVLVLTDGSVTAKNALLKKLGPLGEVQEFKMPSERDLPGWVNAQAKKIGLKIDAPAARLLAGLIGQDTWMLTSELDKLCVFANGETVREDDVRELVSRASDQKAYFLSDAVVDGQGAKAARLLEELIDDGAALQVLLATVANRYRRIAIAKEMMERSAPGAEIARRVGVKPNFALDRLLDQASRNSWPAIRWAYDRIIQSELDVKRGLMDDRVALELVVQELASSRGARAA